MILAALAVLHPDQAAALLGIGTTPPGWRFAALATPLPIAYLTAIAAAGLLLLLVLLPFLEEFRRCRPPPAGEPQPPAAADDH